MPSYQVKFLKTIYKADNRGRILSSTDLECIEKDFPFIPFAGLLLDSYGISFGQVKEVIFHLEKEHSHFTVHLENSPIFASFSEHLGRNVDEDFDSVVKSMVDHGWKIVGGAEHKL